MKTAKVWEEEVRVLWAHSAAWMALETSDGELEGMEINGRRLEDIVREGF